MADLETLRDLRTEWLKLKGCLFDPVSGLPSLPAVLDGVRSRLEGGERLGLVYLDLSSGGRLEAATGWQSHDELIGVVARTLRSSRPHLVGERDPLAVLGVRSDELVAFLGLDGAGDLGSRLESLHRALLAEVEETVRRCAPGGLDGSAPFESAAIPLELEPTVRIERSIYKSLDRAREVCRQARERRHSGRLTAFLRLLERREVLTRFQPIVRLADGGVLGFEALSAARVGELFESPEVLFSFAEESGRIVELDRLCRSLAIAHTRALRSRGLLPAGGKLFLNCSPPAFGDPELCAGLLAAVTEAGLETRDVVLELTERVAITEWRAFRRSLDAARQAGFEIAIDDMGSGYSSLHAVAEIEPDFLKLDLSLIHGIHASRIKRDLLASLAHLAERIGARTVAEGLEGERELEVVRGLGIEYGQGYLFARPAPAEELEAVRFPRRAAG